MKDNLEPRNSKKKKKHTNKGSKRRSKLSNSIVSVQCLRSLCVQCSSLLCFFFVLFFIILVVNYFSTLILSSRVSPTLFFVHPLLLAFCCCCCCCRCRCSFDVCVCFLLIFFYFFSCWLLVVALLSL